MWALAKFSQRRKICLTKHPYTKDNGLSTVNQPTSSQHTLSTLLLGITHSSFFPPVKEKLSVFSLLLPVQLLFHFSSFALPFSRCATRASTDKGDRYRNTSCSPQEALTLHSGHSKETFGFSSTGIHIAWHVGYCFGYGNAFAHHQSADNEQSSGLMIFIRKKILCYHLL